MARFDQLVSKSSVELPLDMWKQCELLEARRKRDILVVETSRAMLVR
jgi:hypothetical protein